MKPWRKIGIVTVAILAFGAARMPFESALSRDLRQAKLTPEPLKIDTRERIGQTSSAVALGGLRTLVATFLNLRAFGFFQERRWDDVSETFETIVNLAPHTRYYWETGSWHSAYNAASDYLNESKLPALRRREAWRSSILRGRAFLERGIHNNPKDWSLHAYLGNLLYDRNKFPAFRDFNETSLAASEAFKKAADTGMAPTYARRFQFYALARVTGKEAEALAMARQLYADPRNRTTSLLVLLFVLEAHENPSMDVTKRAIELFETPQKAYEALCDHWRRTKEHLPIFGVAPALESLERILSIPAEKSIFNEPMLPPTGPDQWFGIPAPEVKKPER